MSTSKTIFMIACIIVAIVGIAYTMEYPVPSVTISVIAIIAGIVTWITTPVTRSKEKCASVIGKSGATSFAAKTSSKHGISKEREDIDSEFDGIDVADALHAMQVADSIEDLSVDDGIEVSGLSLGIEPLQENSILHHIDDTPTIDQTQSH